MLPILIPDNVKLNNMINNKMLLKQKYKIFLLIENNHNEFEVQLLKFLQLVFETNNVINKVNLNKWMNMEKLECQQLTLFFDNFYKVDNILLITKWLDLLATKPFIKQNPIENLYDFFEDYFPLLILEGNNDQEKLSNLYLKLNFNFETFDLMYGTYQKIADNTIHKKWTQNIIINGIDIMKWEITTIYNFTKDTVFPVFNKSEFIII